MKTDPDPLQHQLMIWDRPGPGWWVRRFVATFIFVPQIVGLVLAVPGGPVDAPWVLLVIGASLGILFTAWGYYRWLFSHAIEQWGFGRRVFGQAFLFWVVSGTAWALLGHWWEGVCHAAGGFNAQTDYMWPGVSESFTWQGSALVGLIAAAEAFMALFRVHHRLREARDQALRAKLAPHFIFNTLNTLHAQIEADPRGAQATTERLAQLFRQVLEASDRPTIPLKQELAFVEAYLGIEQARMGTRLRVRMEVPEELESFEVPPLSLQVLVENAIKHGVAPLERGGEIRVVVRKIEGALELSVSDPGTGFSEHKGTGTALATLRARLAKPEDLFMGMEGGVHRVGFRWRLA